MSAPTVNLPRDPLQLAVVALLEAEWSGYRDRLDRTCPCCGGRVWKDHQKHPRHDKGCSLDAALKAVGLLTPESRDEERRLRGIVEWTRGG